MKPMVEEEVIVVVECAPVLASCDITDEWEDIPPSAWDANLSGKPTKMRSAQNIDGLSGAEAREELRKTEELKEVKEEEIVPEREVYNESSLDEVIDTWEDVEYSEISEVKQTNEQWIADVENVRKRQQGEESDI